MTYEEVKEVIDTAVENADADISTQTGTITNLIISGAAVPIAGLYGYADAVGLKPFADVCSPQDLIKHAQIKGVAVSEGMDDDDLRRAVLTAYRIPPSSADMFSWENTISAAIGEMPAVRFRMYENAAARGMGTADVVLSHNASGAQVSAVRSALETFRPYGLADLQVSAAVVRNIELQIRIVGRQVSFQGLKDAILDNFGENGDGSIGESIFETRVYGIASNFGVEQARMAWRNAGDSVWTDGGAEAVKEFEDKISAYEQLVVTECDIRENLL